VPGRKASLLSSPIAAPLPERLHSGLALAGSLPLAHDVVSEVVVLVNRVHGHQLAADLQKTRPQQVFLLLAPRREKGTLRQKPGVPEVGVALQWQGLQSYKALRRLRSHVEQRHSGIAQPARKSRGRLKVRGMHARRPQQCALHVYTHNLLFQISCARQIHLTSRRNERTPPARESLCFTNLCQLSRGEVPWTLQRESGRHEKMANTGLTKQTTCNSGCPCV
jgi:hypothetical protein